jgi:hypothetical protein
MCISIKNGDVANQLLAVQKDKNIPHHRPLLSMVPEKNSQPAQVVLDLFFHKFKIAGRGGACQESQHSGGRDKRGSQI